MVVRWIDSVLRIVVEIVIERFGVGVNKPLKLIVKDPRADTMLVVLPVGVAVLLEVALPVTERVE